MTAAPLEPVAEHGSRIERVAYGHGLTVADLNLIPEDGHRYELIDGVVHVTPAPADEHQELSWVLCGILRAAIPAGLRATQAVGVIIAGDAFLIPDVVVVRGDKPRKKGDFPAEDVMIAIEIVSPSTKSMDRWIKPKLYAAAGIPNYWRVELNPLHVVAYRLDETGDYAETARAEAGNRIRFDEPFAVEFDPADLLP